MDFYSIISLVLYLLLMLGIGWYSYKTSESSVEGFMLGGRGLSAPVVALSAGASDMSGWLLMGMPGAVYVSGLSSLWIAIGLMTGAYFNYLLVAPRLRVYTELLQNSVTISQYFERRFQDSSRLLSTLSALVIIIFFTVYTTSGIVAGGKLFESAFGLNYWYGATLSTLVVVGYSSFGGFKAVSITDFVQGIIMLLALLAVPAMIWFSLSYSNASFVEISQKIQTDTPSYFSWFNNQTGWASALVVISAMSWGLGYFGQPHIIVRFMAITSVKALPQARLIGMSWMFLSVLGASVVGLLGLFYMNAGDEVLADPETVFIVLGQVLFHSFVSGFILAAILAAIMSSISSQLLVTSSSLIGDVYHRFFRANASEKEIVTASRLAVIGVALLALSLADEGAEILSIVSHAWAGFGSAFGPLVLTSLFWSRMTREGAFAGLIVGALTVIIWIKLPIEFDGQVLSEWMFAIVPGFLASSVSIIVVSLLTKTPNQEMLEGFDEMVKQTRV